MDIKKMIAEGKTTDEILKAVKAEIEAEQTKENRTKAIVDARNKLVDAFVTYGIALGVIDKKESAENRKNLMTDFTKMEKAIEVFGKMDGLPRTRLGIRRVDTDKLKRDVKRENEKALSDDEIIRKILSGLV
jgi:hypothetical protein|nr:MAG TPA: hypothetical protein [Caudoviricetes sp.]